MTRWSLFGKQKGEYLDIPDVEKQFRATGSDTFRLVGGKVVGHWVELDTLHLGRQIAAIVPFDSEGEE